MAFAVPATFAHTGVQPSGTGSSSANAASGIASGNALLVFVTANTGGERAALESSNPLWTLLGTAVANGSTRRSWAFGRIANGSSDAFTLDRSDAACTMSASMIRFTGHFVGTVAQLFDVSVAGDNGAFSGINFGAKTPSWGAQDNLWVGGLSLTTSDQTDPAGYTQLFSTDIDGGFIGWRNEAWFRNLNAASEDPPNFGSGADLVTGFFVAVRPVASALDDTADGVTLTATASLTAGSASVGVTASGAVVTATASLTAGGAFAGTGANAAGVTLTATASLTAGAGAGNNNATLNFQAAGMEFGARTGLGIGTFALDAAVNYRYTVHADGLVLGAAVYTSGVLATDSAGKLPNLTNAALFTGHTYRVHAIRQADGEACTFRMVAA
jgi:hypothetical protein